MKIVLAPFYLHRSLLTHLRKEDPFINVKIIDKGELEKFYYPSVLEGALIYLMMEKKYSYETSMHYLRYIPYVYNNYSTVKLSFLSDLKKELLEKDYFYIENSDHNIYKNKVIDIYGYSKDDIEINLLLKALHSEAIYHENSFKKENREVITFSRIEDEVYYVLNEIASLIEKGVSISDIYIMRRNTNYDYYLKKYAPTYGYQINIDNKDAFASLGAYKEFERFYKKNHDIEESLELLKEVMHDDDMYPLFEDQVRSLVIEGASFEVQFDYLSHRLKEKKIPVDRYDVAVEVGDEPIFASQKHIFVIGLAQGQYPSSQKDTSYLSYEELHDINRNNIKDETRHDESLLIDFFNSDNHFYFSFAKKDLGGEYYISPLVRALGLKEMLSKLPKTFYSEEVLALKTCELFDMARQYGVKNEDYMALLDVVQIEYNCFNNEYTLVPVYNKDSKLNSLSTTSLEAYSKCPFSYYLNNVLKIDDFVSSFQMNVGNLAHEIFEHLRDDNFDFERIFSEEIAKNEYKNSELFLLTGPIKKQLLSACSYILKRDQYMKNPCFKNEIKLEWNVDNNTKVVGKIDSLIFLDAKYFVCVDYKTGSTKFDPGEIKYGTNTQLPTYAILVKEDKRYDFGDYELAGYYLNSVLTSSIKDTILGEEDLIPSYFKLNGMTLSDVEAMSAIDSTVAGEKSSFINGISFNHDRTFKKGSKVISEEGFLTIENTVRELYIEMAKRIRENDFRIWPLFSKKTEGCAYCPYKDICYVTYKQRRIVTEEEKTDE